MTDRICIGGARADAAQIKAEENFDGIRDRDAKFTAAFGPRPGFPPNDRP
jgi:hypothetical protein